MKPKHSGKLLDELGEMHRRVNEWQKPYDDYGKEWTREATRIVYPILAKIIRLVEKHQRRAK